MNFETTKPPNFIKKVGSESRLSIGLLSDAEFKVFAKSMASELEKHWRFRKKENL